jgi:hypothetical protein
MCHKKDAESAIQAVRDGVEDELYVCRECAKAERLRRQKKSQRTRKLPSLPRGVSMSVTQIGGDEPPPQIIEAIMNAMSGVVSGIDRAAKAMKSNAPEMTGLSLKGVDRRLCVAEGIQLEGLFLIGEIEAVRRALHALDMDLVGYMIDGVNEAGHVYKLKYSGSAERAERIRDEIVAQELNARTRLFEEMPRVFGDSLCRALAILKNARLLSSGELFDLLSPLRLAAMEKMLDGITLRGVESLIASIDIYNKEDTLDQRQRDKIDAARADDMNSRFEDVVISEDAEGRFL